MNINFLCKYFASVGGIFHHPCGSAAAPQAEPFAKPFPSPETEARAWESLFYFRVPQGLVPSVLAGGESLLLDSDVANITFNEHITQQFLQKLSKSG